MWQRAQHNISYLRFDKREIRRGETIYAVPALEAVAMFHPGGKQLT
jgi:hypothetical protein